MEKTKKIISIAGARPQFVKTGIMHQSLVQHSRLQHLIIHTGQHYDADMSGNFFHDLQIPPPAYNLNINRLSHGAMTGRMLEAIEAVLMKEMPDMVLVYGDTNSTLAGALAAKKLHLPIAHIEAGLRSFDNRMPEEINRILTDRISNLLFCPTEQAIKNLEQEGYRHFDCELYLSGDIMFDAALHFSRLGQPKGFAAAPFLLTTLHREETITSPGRLRHIVKELNRLQQSINILFPAHPRTKAALENLEEEICFMMVPPMGYLDMLQALAQCSCVITDSGGLQKEAYFFRKPCITLRDTTEWTELVNAGVNMLWKEGDSLAALYTSFMEKGPDFSQAFYGTGKSCDFIAEKVLAFINRTR
ncbi:MAG: UDP-N-acetylglucosamine 2-epimerase (non-hydrolyzing) [Williamsia sp.]|nr:UDP-N-acetylglucosamine 2-epimerase (non-hydrolyzing) [Williamsia sp.]